MTATRPAATAGEIGGEEQSTGKGRRWNVEFGQKKVKRAELVHLSRQLAAFLRAGISLLSALEVLKVDGETETIRRVLGELAEDLVNGSTLTDAVDRHPKDFPLYYRRMLRAAELTGRLDDVLDQLALYLERDLSSRQKVTSALLYPAIVAGMAVVTIVILSIGVLPKFATFFKSLNAKLPLPTRMLLNFAHFMGEWGLIIFATLLIVVVVLFLLSRTDRGRGTRDRILLRLPIIGPVIRVALYERFCRLLASMLQAGVGLLAALRVTGDALSNTVFIAAIEQIGANVVQGEGLTVAVTATGMFPATVTQMIRVGEETGSLATQLELSADFYAGELDYKLKKLTTLVEPVVVVGVGLAVGFVAIALISAMYGIFRQVG
jgi:type IV pilus assembly protein PilC